MEHRLIIQAFSRSSGTWTSILTEESDKMWIDRCAKGIAESSIRSSIQEEWP